MERNIHSQIQKILQNKNVHNTNTIIGGGIMAKKGQRATWENDHFKGPRKSDAARVPEVNSVGKEK